MLALVSLVVPLVVTWLLGSGNDRLVLLPWVLALTPAFVLAYYKGLRGSVVAMAAGMLALFIWTLLRSRQGLPRAPWEIQALVVASYAAFCLGLGIVVEVLHRRLEEADGGVGRDPLTGLPNRRHIELTLDAAATSARAEKRDLSVVLVDVDHFTWLIEAHGRSAGDRVVAAIAKLLDDLADPSWLCGRTGQDALVAILPDTDRNGALRVAETVRQGAASLDLPWEPLSIGVGVATLCGPVRRGRQLLEDAERSLARAKALGRDRVEVAAGQSSSARPSEALARVRSSGAPVGIVALPADSRPPVRRVLEISGLRVMEFDDPHDVRLQTDPNDRPVVAVTEIPRLSQLDDELWSLSANLAGAHSLVVFVDDATGADRLPQRPGVTLLKGRPTAEGLLPVIGGLLAEARAGSTLGVKAVVGGFESGLSGKDALLTAARILIVDDEERPRQALRRALEAIGFRDIVAVSSGEEALALVVEHPPDAIILDLQMPEMDGFAVLDHLGPLLEGDGFLPVLVVTGDQEREHRQRVLSSGAKDFLHKPFDVAELGARLLNLLETRRLHLQLRDTNVVLEDGVRHRTRELGLAKDEIIFRLARAAEYRDDVTGRHAARVAAASAVLATALDLDSARCEMIQRAAPLHDVGKIGIPDAILLKPGRLTADEMDVMRCHTTIGGDLLAHSTSDVIETARVIALTHHERWDGGGYPMGLKGEAIPIEGRLVALVDALDALTHLRPYKRAYPFDESMRRLITESGSAFDPEVVTALQATAFRVRDIVLEPDDERPHHSAFAREGPGTADKHSYDVSH